MDPTTASYYRAILFADSQDSRPLPPTLVLLHAWTVKRCQALGLGSNISKQSALNVAMTWMSTTDEGREFTISEFATLSNLFSVEPKEEAPVSSEESEEVDWNTVPMSAKVIVNSGDGQAFGEYVGRRSGAWIDVLIEGKQKSFRRNQVKLAGA